MGRIRRTLAIINMIIMAISANAWSWLSPYADCMNDPVEFVDVKTLTVNGPGVYQHSKSQFVSEQPLKMEKI